MKIKELLSQNEIALCFQYLLTIEAALIIIDLMPNTIQKQRGKKMRSGSNLENKQADMRLRITKKANATEVVPFRGKISKNCLTESEERVLGVIVAERHHEIIRSGWPDFGVIVNGKLVGVEVKRYPYKLQPSQNNAHRLLKKCGIDVVIIRGDRPLTEIYEQVRKKISK